MSKFVEKLYVSETMLLVTTMLTNSTNEEAIEDIKKVIEFIGLAYRQDGCFISEAQKIIVDDLSGLQTNRDANIYFTLLEKEDELTPLYELKYDQMKLLESYGKDGSEHARHNFDKVNSYSAKKVFLSFRSASSTGDLLFTRAAAILAALGIGCNVDYPYAITRFKQCLYWGDVPSAYMLSYVCQLSGQTAEAELYYNVARLMDYYLFDGISTVTEEGYDEEAKSLYKCISYIRTCIINRHHSRYTIDFPFVEVMMFNISVAEKMDYIVNYDDRKWHDKLKRSGSEPIGFI